MIFQVLQIGLRTGRVTLLDDDNGIVYAQSMTAEATAKPTPHLYSVDDQTGQVLEVNYDEGTHPYDDATVQATLTQAAYAVSTTSIRSLSGDKFTASMVGDTIRFRSLNQEAQDQVRVILTASALAITFAAVAGLSHGDAFLIAPIRFRIRFAPMIGASRLTAKTVQGLQIRARPGDRSSASKLTARLFADYAVNPTQESQVDVFVGDESSRTTADRILSLEAQGGAIELEVENLETRNDFELELIEVEVHEEADQRLDVES